MQQDNTKSFIYEIFENHIKVGKMLKKNIFKRLSQMLSYNIKLFNKLKVNEG